LQNIRQDGLAQRIKMEKIRIKRAALGTAGAVALAFGVWYGQHRVHEAQIDKAVVDVGANAETKRQHEILKKQSWSW